MTIWYRCNCCGKEYPVNAYVTRWEDAKNQLEDICSWCGKGRYIKIRR